MASFSEVHSGFDFAFLQHTDTIKYIRKSKVMVLIRGLPGSGKSTLAQAIRGPYPSKTICPDNSMQNVRENCQLLVSSACSKAINMVVVDDCNIKMEHMKGYFDIARQYGYIVLVVEPCTPWKFDAHSLSKNCHGMSRQDINHMMAEWETCVPVSFGWTMNSTDTKKLVEQVAGDVLETFNTMPACVRDFKINGIPNVQRHFISTIRDGVLQCISCFCMRNENRCVMYTQQPEVQKAYCKVSDLRIVGFVISKETFSARVKLNNEQAKVWYQDDHFPNSSGKLPPYVGEVAGTSSKPNYEDITAVKEQLWKNAHSNAVQVVKKQSEKNPNETVTELMLKIKIDNSSDVAGMLNSGILEGLAIRIKQTNASGQRNHAVKQFPNDDDDEEKKYYIGEMSPGKKKEVLLKTPKMSHGGAKPNSHAAAFEVGSRAHILIGRARDTHSIQGGLDVLKVVEQENIRKPHTVINCKNGRIYQYGEGLWYFALHQDIVLKTLFAGYF